MTRKLNKIKTLSEIPHTPMKYSGSAHVSGQKKYCLQTELFQNCIPGLKTVYVCHSNRGAYWSHLLYSFDD